MNTMRAVATLLLVNCCAALSPHASVLHRCGELRDGWVECDARDDGGAVQQPAQVVPLKSLAWPQLSVQLLVQEAANKR